jgi:hypothetical protein
MDHYRMGPNCRRTRICSANSFEMRDGGES